MVSQLDLSDNQLCGLDRYWNGTYTAEGITAFADALCVNGALTKCDLRYNNIGGIGEASIRSAEQGKKAGFVLHL
jgi:hypothetical protein